MFGNYFRTREERLCQKYKQLMQRSYKLALTDKEKSDELNQKARLILEELKRMNYKDLDKCL
jgi:hypothetical protein